MSTHLLDTLGEVADLLEKFEQSWALVGGLAVSAYVEPRFTRDIDIVVSVTGDSEAEEIVRRWRTSGFEISSVVEQDETNRLATIRSQRPGAEHGVVVDLIFASSGIEPEIADGARSLELVSDLEVPVARPGHLVALKLLASDAEQRPQDRIDLEELAGTLDKGEIQAARSAVELIEERDYHRGRDLSAMLDDYLAD